MPILELFQPDHNNEQYKIFRLHCQGARSAMQFYIHQCLPPHHLYQGLYECKSVPNSNTIKGNLKISKALNGISIQATSVNTLSNTQQQITVNSNEIQSRHSFRLL